MVFVNLGLHTIAALFAARAVGRPFQRRRFIQQVLGVVVPLLTLWGVGAFSYARASQSVEEWGLKNLDIGYGISLDEARGWGLAISGSIAEKEPYPFCEPGLFIVRPDGELYLSFITTAPFLRPDYDMLMECLEFTIRRDYPARGTLG